MQLNLIGSQMCNKCEFTVCYTLSNCPRSTVNCSICTVLFIIHCTLNTGHFTVHFPMCLRRQDRDLGFLIPLVAAGQKIQVFCRTVDIMNMASKFLRFIVFLGCERPNFHNFSLLHLLVKT